MPIIDLQVVASADDGYERESSGVMNITGIAVWCEANPNIAARYWGGLRWSNGYLPPKGSIITAAYIEVYVTATRSDDINGNLHFEKAASPSQFSTDGYDITSRARTNASASWIEDELGIGWVQSPSLIIPLQEIIDNYSPTDLVLILRPNTDIFKEFSFFSYDEFDGSYAAKLHIEYTLVGPLPMHFRL
jgi:hypothetical protein